MEKPLFDIHGLRCSYDRNFVAGKSKVVLEIRNLTVHRGKKIFIVGESGIGKSTILEVLGLMNNTIVKDSSAAFLFYDKEGKEYDFIRMWERNSDKELSAFRLRHFNFIFQNTNLMRNFTAYENVAITRMLQGQSEYACFKRTASVLEDLGLSHIDKERMAQELSGGQQQRLSFARAILPDFSVLFGDEPTGNLDGENAVKVMKILSDKLVSSADSSAVIVSHDMHLAVTFADVIVKIRKCRYESPSEGGEISYYGMIDTDDVYCRDTDEGDSWTNGADCYPSQAFEQILKTNRL